jgi:hypothetical protein
LHILDPLNLANNTTRNSYLIKQILKHFELSGSSLRKKIAEPLVAVEEKIGAPDSQPNSDLKDTA